MSSIAMTLLVAVTTFCGGAIGLALKRLTPDRYTAEHSRDTIVAVVGLVTLLLALVLGLLVWSSYGVFTAQRTGVQTFASQIRQLDLALADLGAEAKPLRDVLKREATHALEEFWGDQKGDFVSRNFRSAVDNISERKTLFDTLHPATDDQKQILAAARQLATSIGQTRLLMALQLDDPMAAQLLGVVAAWAFVVFCGHGLLSRADPIVVTTLAIGAIAVASAIFLIVDLSQPYSGLTRVSPSPLERVLADIDK